MKGRISVLLIGVTIAAADVCGSEVYTGSAPPTPTIMAANLPSVGRYVGSMNNEGVCITGFFLREGIVVDSYVFCPIENASAKMWVLMGDHEGKQRLVVK